MVPMYLLVFRLKTCILQRDRFKADFEPRWCQALGERLMINNAVLSIKDGLSLWELKW